MSNPIFKLLDTETKVMEGNQPNATRQVEVICSTESADRIGDVIVQEGIDTRSYTKNPVVLWGHDSDRPVARATRVFLQNGSLRAIAEFPPAGEDADSDWVFGKIKNKLVNAVSIGFIPKEWEPVDPKSPWDGYKFVESEMVEFSFCSVPMNAEALIVGRSLLPSKSKDLLPSKVAAMVLGDSTASVEVVGTETDPATNTDPDPVIDPEKELDVALARIATEVVEVKAGRKLSAANEAKLRAAHESIGSVLEQLPAADPEPDADDKSATGNVRPSRADMEGRSDSSQFPLRVRREVDLLKMRRELQAA